MIPVRAILGSLPPVSPAVAGLNWLLRKAWNSIRPRCVALLDAVEVDGCIEGHIVVDDELGLISIPSLNMRDQSHAYLDIIAFIQP